MKISEIYTPDDYYLLDGETSPFFPFTFTGNKIVIQAILNIFKEEFPMLNWRLWKITGNVNDRPILVARSWDGYSEEINREPLDWLEPYIGD